MTGNESSDDDIASVANDATDDNEVSTETDVFNTKDIVPHTTTRSG